MLKRLNLAEGTTSKRTEYVKTRHKTTIKGLLVQNSFLHGFEIENASKLKMYIKLENKNVISD